RLPYRHFLTCESSAHRVNRSHVERRGYLEQLRDGDCPLAALDPRDRRLRPTELRGELLLAYPLAAHLPDLPRDDAVEALLKRALAPPLSCWHRILPATKYA